MIRLLTSNDREQAKSLWRSTFDDSNAFVEWFFNNRFFPQWSVGVFNGQKLISVIHGTPMELSSENSFFPAVMTSGIATATEERGKGHMHAAMRFLQSIAEQRGIHALFNHPEKPGAYTHLGFRPSTFTKYWYGKGTFFQGQIKQFSEEKAFSIYSAATEIYAGFARRDREAFHLKMADYTSDMAKGFLLEEEGKTVGYCIYFEREDVYGEEVISLSGYGPILYELKRIANGKFVSAKLPPDANIEGEISAQNVMLASSDIWQIMKGSYKPCFCVDEY